MERRLDLADFDRRGCWAVTQSIPDLHTQLEDLLHQVWSCEAEWRAPGGSRSGAERLPAP